jgi:hypothetical protein
MTLSELMSVMRDDMQRVEVIKRNLPNFGYLPADYEVQLFFEGNFVQQLRAASGASHPKLLKVEFVRTSP